MRKDRQVALSTINSSVKGDVALKLLKRYSEPFESWSLLKSRYESNNTTKQMSPIDKFFNIRKTRSMDVYFADMKETTDQMEEVEVGLLEKVVVYHILKNLPSDYDMFKLLILYEKKSSTYLQLEAQLLSKKLGRQNSNQDQSKALSITSQGGNLRRPFSRCRNSTPMN